MKDSSQTGFLNSWLADLDREKYDAVLVDALRESVVPFLPTLSETPIPGGLM
jgi:hypothetical protein